MAIPAHIQAQLDAADAVNPVRDIFGKIADPSLLATVREAVYGQWPPVAASPRSAASLPAVPARPAAVVSGSHATIDPARARAAVAAARAVSGSGDSASRSQASLGRIPVGVDPKAIFASRRQQAVAASTGREAADTEASGPTARQGRPRLPDATSVYAARRAPKGDK
ncbi:hypothetical protein MKK84_14425 [Methylobacterium sp. E-065]|uniref:hypothetical protein n=1 Tax=Methylobacterium sp. E-065 TaxID=2836583 RepID=UPI001FB9CA04|nr:hypothetical protein [Methylobacterium sp. E-065]MCJ2018618.1 hypothetical protein [Methylobacterium sp. E-065]